MRCPSEAAYPQSSPPRCCPCRRGKLVVHCLMRAAMILKSHPRSDAVSRFAPVSIGFQMHFLIFDRAPQPVDENVVHETTASVHRNRDAHGLEPVMSVMALSSTTAMNEPIARRLTFSHCLRCARLLPAISSATISSQYMSRFVVGFFQNVALSPFARSSVLREWRGEQSEREYRSRPALLERVASSTKSRYARPRSCPDVRSMLLLCCGSQFVSPKKRENWAEKEATWNYLLFLKPLTAGPARSLGALGGTRTPTILLTATSRQRVYQFRHERLGRPPRD